MPIQRDVTYKVSSHVRSPLRSTLIPPLSPPTCHTCLTTFCQPLTHVLSSSDTERYSSRENSFTQTDGCGAASSHCLITAKDHFSHPFPPCWTHVANLLFPKLKTFAFALTYALAIFSMKVADICWVLSSTPLSCPLTSRYYCTPVDNWRTEQPHKWQADAEGRMEKGG